MNNCIVGDIFIYLFFFSWFTELCSSNPEQSCWARWNFNIGIWCDTSYYASRRTDRFFTRELLPITERWYPAVIQWPMLYLSSFFYRWKQFIEKNMLFMHDILLFSVFHYKFYLWKSRYLIFIVLLQRYFSFFFFLSSQLILCLNYY